MASYDLTLEDAVEADSEFLGTCEGCGGKVFGIQPHHTVAQPFIDKQGKSHHRDLYAHRDEDCEKLSGLDLRDLSRLPEGR